MEKETLIKGGIGVGIAGVFGVIGGVTGWFNDLTSGILNTMDIHDRLAESSVTEELRTEAPSQQTITVFTEQTTAGIQMDSTAAAAEQTTEKDQTAPAQTEGQTAAQTTASQVSDGSTYKVQTIAAVSPRQKNQVPSTFFTYNPNDGQLYFLSDNTHIAAYDFATGTVSEIADVTDKAEIHGLAVNPYTGKLYGAVFYPNGTDDHYNKHFLYDFSDDKELIKDIFFRNDTNSTFCMTFPDADTLLITCGCDYTKCSLKDGTANRSTLAFNDQLFGKEMHALYPILWNDAYYYVILEHLYIGENYWLNVTKTTQLLPSASTPVTCVTNLKDMLGISLDSGDLYYMDSDHNIYLCDPDADRSGGSLLTEEYSDTLVIDGSSIQNTATSYLTDAVPCFIRIDSNRYVMYDEGDKALKLLSAE